MEDASKTARCSCGTTAKRAFLTPYNYPNKWHHTDVTYLPDDDKLYPIPLEPEAHPDPIRMP